MFELLLAYAVAVTLAAVYHWKVRQMAERDAERFRQAAMNARNQAAELALRNSQLEREARAQWPAELEAKL